MPYASGSGFHPNNEGVQNRDKGVAIGLAGHRLRNLKAVVFAAYGWPDNISDQEILARLLSLNLEREPA